MRNELRDAQFMAAKTPHMSALYEFLIKKRLVDKREPIVELYALSSQGQAKTLLWRRSTTSSRCLKVNLSATIASRDRTDGAAPGISVGGALACGPR